MSSKTGTNHIHLFKQRRVESKRERMKDTQSERGAVVRGLMKELAVFTQAVESRLEDRETLMEGLRRMDGAANSWSLHG